LPLRRLITPLGRTCQFENFRIISWNKNPRRRIWQFKEDVTMKASAGRIAHFFSEAIADSDPTRPGYGRNGQGIGPCVATVTQVFQGGEFSKAANMPIWK
jgi:hypothetical protein